MSTVSSTRSSPSSASAVRERPFPPADVNWPNFFVVGAHKAGSTYLYTHLKRHPEIFLPNVKELMYFQPGRIGYVELNEYRELYAGAKGYQAIGEVTPYYLCDPEVPARIHAVCPAAKIVIVLRDPVDRAYSHYHMDRELDCVTSFHEAVQRYGDKSAKRWSLSQEYIEFGLYYEPVRRYLETFGRDRVIVLLFDDIKARPNDLLARVAQHIGVDPGFFDGLDVSEPIFTYHKPKFAGVRWVQQHGLTRFLPHRLVLAVRPIFFNTKKPGMDDETRGWLQNFYEPDIASLEELLGRKLPELRRTWR